MVLNIKNLNKVLLKMFIKKFPRDFEYTIPRKFCFLLVLLISSSFI
jgi:hypothetical protein